jgi:hypothetical protein
MGKWRALGTRYSKRQRLGAGLFLAAPLFSIAPHLLGFGDYLTFGIYWPSIVTLFVAYLGLKFWFSRQVRATPPPSLNRGLLHRRS